MEVEELKVDVAQTEVIAYQSSFSNFFICVT